MSNIKYIRPTWSEYYFEVMYAISKRATCGRGRSGCVITKDKHIISTGYVGAPIGFPSCDDIGHVIQEVIESDGSIGEHCIRTVHAEQNAICQAAKQGIAVEGAELYCSMTPCRTCAMLIIQCGIKKVHCISHYPHKDIEENTLYLFNYAGIEITFENNKEQEYEQEE